MIAATFFIIVLLIIFIPFCLYVRNHRMKDIDVNIALFSGIKFRCSFYNE